MTSMEVRCVRHIICKETVEISIRIEGTIAILQSPELWVAVFRDGQFGYCCPACAKDLGLLKSAAEKLHATYSKFAVRTGTAIKVDTNIRVSKKFTRPDKPHGPKESFAFAVKRRFDSNGKPKKNPPTRCKCGAKGRKLHPCPYQEDVRNNSEPHCNCCKACEKECSKDI